MTEIECCCARGDDYVNVTLPLSRVQIEFYNYPRNSMGEKRLSNLTVLSIESNRVEGLDIDLVVDEFEGRHQNRRITLHYRTVTIFLRTVAVRAVHESRLSSPDSRSLLPKGEVTQLLIKTDTATRIEQ